MDYDNQFTGNAFDACLDETNSFSEAMDIFSSDMGDYIDNSSNLTFGDVVDSGIDAFSAYEQMETVCDYGSN